MSVDLALVPESALPWLQQGGDLALTAQGDLALVEDLLDDVVASRQRLVRLVLTNPTTYDALGNPVARPDDFFNPTWGSGARAAVGGMVTPSLTATIQSNILDAIAGDPFFATSPAPSVTVSLRANATLVVAVIATTLSGQVVTLPSLPLIGT